MSVAKYGVLVVLSLVAQIDVVLAALLSTVAALVPGLFVGIAAKYVFDCNSSRSVPILILLSSVNILAIVPQLGLYVFAHVAAVIGIKI